MSAAPPNGPIEIVFCFDTTGSMCEVLQVVKDRVTELIERLLADIAAIRIGILAHGDYGDEPYMLQQLDLTNDGDQLRQFISTVRETSGYDPPECYELALHEVRTNFSWTPDTRKRLVIIGDNEPHDLMSSRNLRKIDWRKETKLLRDELQMAIYSVQARPSEAYEWFWKGMADMTGGKYLELCEVSSIFDFLMAICYLEHGVEFFQTFEQEVRSRESGGPSSDVERMLHRLGASSDAADTEEEEEEEAAASPTRAAGRSSSVRLRGTRRARPMKAKRIRRTVAQGARPKRAAEAFCEAAIAIRGRWSSWQVLAAPDAAGEAQLWRPFGAGFIRNHIAVPAAGAKRRVLVELALSRDEACTSVTPLYSHILCDSARNAATSVLHRKDVLKWRLHRAITQGRRVLLRFAKVDSEGRSLRQQRHQLRKSNSYAWNSGRVVTGGGPQDLESVSAPRSRLLAKFVRALAEERRQAA